MQLFVVPIFPTSLVVCKHELYPNTALKIHFHAYRWRVSNWGRDMVIKVTRATVQPILCFSWDKDTFRKQGRVIMPETLYESPGSQICRTRSPFVFHSGVVKGPWLWICLPWPLSSILHVLPANLMPAYRVLPVTSGCSFGNKELFHENSWQVPLSFHSPLRIIGGVSMLELMS